MNLKELATLFLVGLMLLSFFVGRDTCACEYQEPEPIKITTPAI